MYKNVYYFNGKKVRITDHYRRTGDEAIYTYIDQNGVTDQITCNSEEFEERFVLTNDRFVLTTTIKKEMLYDVLYKIGNCVVETIESGLEKRRAFALRNYCVQQTRAGGRFCHHKKEGFQVERSKNQKI